MNEKEAIAAAKRMLASIRAEESVYVKQLRDKSVTGEARRAAEIGLARTRGKAEGIRYICRVIDDPFFS